MASIARSVRHRDVVDGQVHVVLLGCYRAEEDYEKVVHFAESYLGANPSGGIG